ncbi:hypothetical protein KFL_003710100 [Klebsormidium nitens]|uniref:NAD-dependent epimerase/dehydratase domain-containing protein n=1 Tax=Klebsormidium nitens TaxID=105231 RepID=A0A1Y1I9R1_KLENI|nr:hypothetical protein KFL_003710100 [Klebsormidium nitens]|eukprot:GAQ87704.1 hypothetical protein KFL_003710100 [Klebsormidium nitens]
MGLSQGYVLPLGVTLSILFLGLQRFRDAAEPSTLLLSPPSRWSLEAQNVFQGLHFEPAQKPDQKYTSKRIYSAAEAAGDILHSDFPDIAGKGCPFHGEAHGLFQPDTPRPRFIVTGGAGFIGSNLVKKLSGVVPSEQIKVIDNLWRGQLRNLQIENGSWAINVSRDFCHADLRIGESSERYLRGADYVYHLAIMTGVADDQDGTDPYFDDNVLINTLSLNSCKRNGIPNYIYVAAAIPTGWYMSRILPPPVITGANTHNWMKAMGENEATSEKTADFKVGVLRIDCAYGPHDYVLLGATPAADLAIRDLIQQGINNPAYISVSLRGANRRRTFAYVDDVVESLLELKDAGLNRAPIRVKTQSTSTLYDIAAQLQVIVSQHAGEGANPHIKDAGRQHREAPSPVPARNIDAPESSRRSTLRNSLSKDLERTYLWMRKEMQRPRILVVLFGQARGGELAWRSLVKNLLQPYNAHLALCFSGDRKDTLLHRVAQYDWTVPEYADWGLVWDEVATTCTDNPAGNSTWRKVCGVQGFFMGGLGGCRHGTATGIILAYRWFTQQKLAYFNLLDKYDYVVYSRPDELYLCEHQNIFDSIEDGQVYMPIEEDYGGFQDRHLVGTMRTMMSALNQTAELACAPDYWYSRLLALDTHFNPEKLQKEMWREKPIERLSYNRSMYLVKTKQDPSRFTPAQQKIEYEITRRYNLSVKYPNERSRVLQYCQVNELFVLKELRDKFD